MPTETARAKINLTLHVGRAIADMADPFYGYHPLDSLVVFSDYGDELSCEPADETSLTITGEFADALSSDENNLVLRAYRTVERLADCPALKFSLTKNLPVAAGIGGGSANAAATLRLLKAYIDLTEQQWFEAALNIGADVPVCLGSQTSRMTGIGETVHPLPNLGHIWAVLVNPKEAISTADIFKAFDADSKHGTPRPQENMNSLIECFRAGKNDLQPMALAQLPIITKVLTALSSVTNSQDIRMSGSGATCFALCSDKTEATKMHEYIRQQHSMWWSAVTRLGDT